MELTLNVLRCPDSVVPELRRVGGGEYRVGRGTENDWVLPDPDRVLSKQHFVLEFRNGGWQVRDLSVNGTFHNGSSMPIGRDLTAYLQDGDRIRVGPYEIEVRVQQQGAQTGFDAGAGVQPSWGTPPPAAQRQWDTPLPATPSWGSGDPAWGGQPAQRPGPIQPRMPGDAFAVGGADAPPLPGSGPGGMMHGDGRYTDEGPAMPDHVSPVNAAFYIPQPLAPHLQNWDQPQGGPPAPPPAAGPVPAPPAGAQPPQGWSLDLGGPGAAQPASPPPYMPHQAPQQGPAIGAPAPAPGIPLPGLTPSPVPEPQFAPPTADLRPAVPDWTPPPSATPPGHPGAVPAAAFMPPPTAPAAPLPLPVTPMPAEPQFAPPAPVAPPAPSQNPFENEQSLRAPGLAPIAPPVPVTAAPPMMPLQPPDGRGVAPMAPEPMAMPGAAQAPGGEAAVAALLAGMGLGPTPALMADPNATLRSAGAALRAAIAGIRALLIARADVKREFRIEATMIGVANNPVKFSHNDDAALVALLGAASTGPAAVQETVNDLTAHQVATLAATQAAARALLDRLAPPGLEEADQGGSLFGASREKRLWESYKRLHLQVTQQFEDDFDSAFGKAFARAYEQALRDGRG